MPDTNTLCKISIETKRNHSPQIYHALKDAGLTASASGVFSGQVTRKEYKKLLNYCLQNNLVCHCDSGFGIRSADYRNQFFENNPPVLGRWYFCSYCALPLTKKRVTVDHLYPVYYANKSRYLQKKLKKKGYENINDVKNLIPACRRCNSKKGKKMGVWILRGQIGRHLWFAWVINIVRLAILGLLLWLLWNPDFVFSIVR